MWDIKLKLMDTDSSAGVTGEAGGGVGMCGGSQRSGDGRWVRVRVRVHSTTYR